MLRIRLYVPSRGVLLNADLLEHLVRDHDGRVQRTQEVQPIRPR
ncbi:hypothetical protein GGP44_003096 [Salinibacter ruber]|nr:hypothetical protein [Salinibacter ruber]